MLKVAVIGTGIMGSQHARIYNELYPLCRLEAICDVKGGAADMAKRLNTDFFTDFRKMLAEKRPDVVSIATPNQFHFEMAKACMESGANVLVEKPITITTEDAEELVRIAKKNGVQLMVGHVERFNPAVQYVKERLNELVGDVLYASAKRLGAYPQRLLSGTDADINIYLDLMIHDIDIMRFLFGSDLEIIQDISLCSVNKKVEDYAFVNLKTKGNAICNVESSWLSPVKIRELIINGTKGLIKLDYITQDVHFYPSKKEGTFKDYGELLMQNYEAVKLSFNKKEPLKAEIEHFLDCVRTGTPNMSDGQSGLENLRLIKELQKRRGKE